jgi:hypothetical protein
MDDGKQRQSKKRGRGRLREREGKMYNQLVGEADQGP